MSGPGSATSAAPLRQQADFRRFWLARQVSTAGTLITAVALPVLVYRLSNSPSLTALTTLVEGLPYVIFGFVSGAIADRLDRRRVMLSADLASAVAIGSVPVAHQLGVLTVGHALAAGFLTQACFVFFDGAAAGALPAIVGRNRISQANAALWGFGSLLDLGMPMLTGALLAVLHPAALLAADAASFLASASALVGIASRLSAPRNLPPFGFRSLVDEISIGVRFLAKHPGVRPLTGIGLLISLSGAGFMALSVPYADRLLGVGTSGWRFGAVFAAWGVGGIAAAALTPLLHRRISMPRAVLLALPAAAIAGLIVATSSSFMGAVVAMACWGIAYQTVLLTSVSYRQRATPEALLGRVNTTSRLLSFGVGWTTGALSASAVARVLGLRGALVATVAVGLLAAIYGWLSPLRTLPDGDGLSLGAGGTQASV